MLQKQQPVPFNFQAVQRLDVEDWIEISRLSGCEGHADEPTDICIANSYSETLGNDHQHSQGDARTVDDNGNARECTADRQMKTNSSSYSAERSCTSRTDALPMVPGKQREDARIFNLREELSRAQEAIANAAAMMSMLPHLDSAKADLRRLMETLRMVRCEVVGTNSNCSSEANQRQTGSCCDDAVSDTSVSSSNMPAVLVSFFDYAREVNMLQERIAELSFAISERIVVGTSSITSSAEPDRRHHFDEAKLGSLQTSLNSAKEAAAGQRALCHARGIDPEAFRYRR